MKINNVTIGSDPELFLFSNKENRVISAIGLVGGSKSNPIPISDNGHFLQEDNILIEFNIPPCKTKKELVDNINFVKDYIEKSIAKPNDATCLIIPSAFIDPDQLVHPKAIEFGCDPDFNIWLLDVNPKPDSNTNLRSAGGHVAIGYDNPELETSIELVKAMDLFLGLQSLFLDDDVERRKLYGKSGAFRFKDWGVEYRTLSNFWIKDNNSIEWLYDTVQEVIEFVNSNKIINDEDGQLIMKAINNYDLRLAKQILNKYQIKVCVE